MKTIITISREFGAGGSEIGRRLSEVLGIEYYDKDMVMRTALMDPKLDSKMVNEWENRKASPLSRLTGLFDQYTKPMDDHIWEAQKKAIYDMANKENCIIVGRNANYLLSDYDHVFRVFVYADIDWRVNRLSQMTPDLSREEILSKTRKIDAIRKKNCEFYVGKKFGDSKGYDMTLNIGRIGIEKAVELILKAMED